MSFLLLGLVIAVDIDGDADIDGDDGADDAAERNRRELVHKLHAEEDDQAHEDENHGPIHLHFHPQGQTKKNTKGSSVAGWEKIRPLKGKKLGPSLKTEFLRI
jgi:hypothetical protein